MRAMMMMKMMMVIAIMEASMMKMAVAAVTGVVTLSSGSPKVGQYDWFLEQIGKQLP